ncbi:hypothetical protein TSUD_199080 [Trifolium subterraneum]|uniref:Uncharacterized protein n=1 Tax=Trifolium subterraneum TaxID=3900 RepID=A0A2Z6LR65_TRISU|nr:hypothetical protein TSUD_199080 [Trifolium subterraneum]
MKGGKSHNWMIASLGWAYVGKKSAAYSCSDRVKAFEKCKSFRSQEKGKNSDFLGGGVGDRKLIKDRLRIRTVRGTFKEEVR